MTFMVVDFPAPFGPRNPSYSEGNITDGSLIAIVFKKVFYLDGHADDFELRR
jgi:hypothetical protein